jgi:hypothetical protein
MFEVSKILKLWQGYCGKIDRSLISKLPKFEISNSSSKEKFEESSRSDDESTAER